MNRRLVGLVVMLPWAATAAARSPAPARQAPVPPPVTTPRPQPPPDRESAAASPAAAVPVPLAFDEAVRRALARNPSVASAAADILQAEGLLRQARAATLPLISASGTNTTLDDARGLEIGRAHV